MKVIRYLKTTIFFLFVYITASAQQSDAVLAYIKNYKAIAIEEMQRSGVPAAIKLAQGILESMAGQSELTQKSNNHFGIKCKAGYTGAYVLHDDDAPQERFIKYEKAEQSYKDHSDFLKSRERYASLFTLDPTDYKGWANGLKKAGYATNPKYPQLIISLIEKYNLEDYTLIAMGKLNMPSDIKEHLASISDDEAAAPKKYIVTYPKGIFAINDAKAIFVQKGTTYQTIATQYNISLCNLYAYNDLATNIIVTRKDGVVFLQLKRTVGGKPYHEVLDGESLYDIAQVEGVRMESILKYNNLTKFASPAIGSTVFLQEINSAKNTASLH